MKFKDLPIGSWFAFTNHQMGSPAPPYKKISDRKYLYHWQGWYETGIGMTNLEVLIVERPQDAPHELLDIHIGWSEEINGYLVSTLAYPTRDVEQASETDFPIKPGFVYVEDEITKRDALDGAVAAAYTFASKLVLPPLKVERIVVFVDGNEYLIVEHNNGKAKIHNGAFHPEKKSKKS